MNFSGTWSNLFKHCISLKFLLKEGKVKVALRKALLIAICVERYKTITLERSCWLISCKFQINFSTWNNLTGHCNFAELLLIISYVQSALLILFLHS